MRMEKLLSSGKNCFQSDVADAISGTLAENKSSSGNTESRKIAKILKGQV